MMRKPMPYPPGKGPMPPKGGKKPPNPPMKGK
jgi:hypothetical protein